MAGSTILLALFLLAVLLASAMGYLFDPLPLRGNEYVDRALRAVLTMIIGVAFFLAAAWMNRDDQDLRFSVKWILVGLGFDLAWCGLQAITFYTPWLEKGMVTHWQLAFSMRELVRTNRISGLAYEPAWLAGQMATLFIPWLIASLLIGTCITRYAWLEPALLILATISLFATFSRGGLLATAVAAGFTFMIAGRQSMHRFWSWFTTDFRTTGSWTLRLVLTAGLITLLTFVILFLGQKSYFNRLWNTQAESVQEFIVENSAGARAAYIAGALAAYQEHPWMGVGLGASGFYIYPNLPDWSLTTLPEIARQLNPENQLFPNPKNLFVRLLAETGLLGLIFYIVFQFSIASDALFAFQGNGISRYLGTAGIFSLLAITLYNLTQDSMTQPHIWIIPGILTGFCQMPRQHRPSKHASGLRTGEKRVTRRSE